MSINSIRSLLYKLAKYLGDFNAGTKAISDKSTSPIIKRVGRRVYGKVASRGFNIFK